jgi:hypothetical protein
MNATVEDILQRVRIPEDDGRLNDALADFNSKLAAWSGAIHHAQSSLRDILRYQLGSPTEELDFSRVEGIAESPSEIEAEQPAPSSEEKVSVSQEPCVETIKAVEVETPVLVESAKPSEPINDNDDETLLATLDPETAKRIQVLRRLSGQKKSVRELLEKHQMTTAPSVPNQPSKKSFWRR